MKANVTFFKQKGMQNHTNLHGLGLPQLFFLKMYKKKKTPQNHSIKRSICTQNRTRTCTAVRPLVPETSVSTDSTTWA